MVSVVDVCFRMLEEMVRVVLAVPANSSHKESPLPSSASLLTTSIFTSPLVNHLLSHPHSDCSTTDRDSPVTLYKKTGRGGNH